MNYFESQFLTEEDNDDSGDDDNGNDDDIVYWIWNQAEKDLSKTHLHDATRKIYKKKKNLLRIDD